jgi:hypothetical protein
LGDYDSGDVLHFISIAKSTIETLSIKAMTAATKRTESSELNTSTPEKMDPQSSTSTTTLQPKESTGGCCIS